MPRHRGGGAAPTEGICGGARFLRAVQEARPRAEWSRHALARCHAIAARAPLPQKAFVAGHPGDFLGVYSLKE